MPGSGAVPIPPEDAPLPSEGVPGPGPLGSVRSYAVAVGIVALAISSQYFVPYLVPPLRIVYGNFVGSLAIVYLVPILALAALVGLRPLARWSRSPGLAAWEGLRWYGLLTALAFLVVAFLVALYLRFDPGALQLLSRPNPVLEQARSNPAFWIAFSFAIGAVEETIFRGWIFGYWLVHGTSRWWIHAIWTSALFAGVHVYYGITYGWAAPLVYPSLFLLGVAFCGVVRVTGGNLWMVAVLHGAHDSAAFLSLVSPTASLAVQYGIVAIGLLIALVTLAASSSSRAPPPPRPFGPPGGGRFPGPPTPWEYPPQWPSPGPPPPPPPVPPPPPPSFGPAPVGIPRCTPTPS